MTHRTLCSSSWIDISSSLNQHSISGCVLHSLSSEPHSRSLSLALSHCAATPPLHTLLIRTLSFLDRLSRFCLCLGWECFQFVVVVVGVVVGLLKCLWCSWNALLYSFFTVCFYYINQTVTNGPDGCNDGNTSNLPKEETWDKKDKN